MNDTPESATPADPQAPLNNTLFGIAEHDKRLKLHNELNAGAYEVLTAPVQISHLVLISDSNNCTLERQRVAQLCERYGVAPPTSHQTQFSADLGMFRLRWERHTEYTTYTFYHSAPFATPFEDPAVAHMPKEWLASLPGEVLAATHIALDEQSQAPRPLPELAKLFASNSVIGSQVADGRASVWRDNQIHSDGFTRILIHDEGLTHRQAGRLVQRLLEIETYRMLAMLPVPTTRQLIPQLAEYDRKLAKLTAAGVKLESVEDEQTMLNELTHLASEIERISAEISHRFNASRAYYAIIKRRITELREIRIEGLQMLQEFIEQRLESAMGTCELVQTKLETLSLRVGRASALLQTRVDITLEAQTRDVLKSMDRRARLQLRLQETVEGLSVVVLSYYLLGIVGYGLKALKASGIGINTDLATGLAIPVVVGIVFYSIRRLRRLASKKSGGGE